MTLIIAWIGIDQSKKGESVSSLYFGSDSRYSWKDQFNYDHGIKLFGTQNFPEIFGFCGDVLFPSVVISQLIPLIDSGLLFNKLDSLDNKHHKVYEYVKNSLKSYPSVFAGNKFSILHGTRKGKEFSCSEVKFEHGAGLNLSRINLPNYSTCIYSGGSGSVEFKNNWSKWSKPSHNNYRTSRAVYHCFTESLENMKDPLTGGFPQIIGLYRVHNSKIFGYVKNEKLYIYGKAVSQDTNIDEVEWRNENFERIDPNTKYLFEGAQRQPF